MRRRRKAWCWSHGAGVSGGVGKSKGRGARAGLGGEPDLVAALADIGPEAADDGGEAVGQRGERRCMCHTLISAWGVGGEKGAFRSMGDFRIFGVGVRVAVPISALLWMDDEI